MGSPRIGSPRIAKAGGWPPNACADTVQARTKPKKVVEDCILFFMVSNARPQFVVPRRAVQPRV